MVQGRGVDGARIAADAAAVADAGAFAVVLEKVPDGLARRITAELAVPTIGIGASAGCDGQVLVVDDMLGLFTAFRPKFVKRYAELGNDAAQAISAYADDVRARIEGVGLTSDAGSPEAFTAVYQRDADVWGGVIKRIGLQLDI